MRLFLDIHDKKNKTFPSELSRDEFEKFLGAFASSCHKEGVAIVRSHVNLECGRAFCLTMAKDEEAVRRAHAEVELGFDSITEVETASPHDAFFERAKRGR
ncbi:MAG: DUF4242 domain-containing protein [Acidobacteriia bacterium]|nr:DUF4242 domain-containing protein [Terriglobia bacterium]